MAETTKLPPTRRQGYFGQALDDVQGVLDRKNRAAATIYGGLCHSFPILVRTCGLCQAVAYVEAKASKDDDRGLAYRWLRAHVKARLGLPETGDLLARVQGPDLRVYMRDTLTILEAWVFYKRFAVSLLKVEAGQDEEAVAAGLLPAAEVHAAEDVQAKDVQSPDEPEPTGEDAEGGRTTGGHG